MSHIRQKYRKAGIQTISWRSIRVICFMEKSAIPLILCGLDAIRVQAGVSRFTGFNIPGLKEDNEDIDVIATCYRDELFGYTLATFKVGTNVDGMDTADAREKLADVLSCTYFQPDLRYRCFQPDCVKLKI